MEETGVAGEKPPPIYNPEIFWVLPLIFHQNREVAFGGCWYERVNIVFAVKTTPRPPGACKDDKTCKEFTGMSPSAPMCDPNQHYTTEDGKHKLVDLCPIRCGLCKGGNVE